MTDKAHIMTDKEIERMERHLSVIYRRAEKELTEKAEKYFARFAELDAKKRELVDAGKLTEQEYKRWRQNKIMTGKHWTDMKEQAAQELLNANKTAQAYINDQLPKIYSINYNGFGEAVESAVTGYSFELVDVATVKRLATSDKTLLPYKYVDGKKDVRWNTQKVNSEIMQGIIQGESIPKMAKRLQNVTEMNRVSAIRNARTTATSAENKGRMDSFHHAEEMGIQIKKVWIAANDTRTREAHAELDGEEADIDEPFVNSIGEIMFPGDPDADPANVYNCRCTLGTKIVGFGAAKDATNIFGEQIEFSEKLNGNAWGEPKMIINNLAEEYKTKLKTVVPGAHQAAGSVQISGTVMHLSSSAPNVAIHEFAHTISLENQTKFGLYDESAFWKEIKKVQRQYKKAVEGDSSRWISAYEHSLKGADEFMAEAFTQAKMDELGLKLPNKYGRDLTFSREVLKIIDKYFRK